MYIVHLTGDELDTVLFALRRAQEDWPETLDNSPHLLTVDAVDALCEKINCSVDEGYGSAEGKATRYRVYGPFSGDTDCEPAEPGKQWIAVATAVEDESMENEVCVIVNRKGPPTNWQWAIATAIATLLEEHQPL